MKTYCLLLFVFIIIGCQNRNRVIEQADPINHITYEYKGVKITRVDEPGVTKFIYGEKEDQNNGVIWAKYSGINDGFKGYLKFLDNGKVFLLSGDGYFQSSNLDTTKFEFKRILANQRPVLGSSVYQIQLSIRYEKEKNLNSETEVKVLYKSLRYK